MIVGELDLAVGNLKDRNMTSIKAFFFSYKYIS